MTQYHLQYSFSTKGKENTAVLRALRDRLALLQDNRIQNIYDEFNIVPVTQPKQSDIMTGVDTLHVNAGTDCFAFFVLRTETETAPFMSLWTAICKQFEPRIRVDVIGAGPGKEQFCQPLYVPSNLKFNETQIRDVSKTHLIHEV